MAFAAAVLFTVVNALGKALLFLAVDLRGPLVGAAFAVGAFSVAGVPPAAGFFGKAALFEAGIEGRQRGHRGPALRRRRADLRLPVPDLPARVYWRPQPEQRPSPAAARAVVAVLAAAVLLLGAVAEPLLTLSEQAGEALVGMVP